MEGSFVTIPENNPLVSVIPSTPRNAQKRPMRDSAISAREHIKKQLEWEECSEQSEMFQNIAQKIDSEFKSEMLDSHENQQVLHEEESEYSENDSESEYESSFVTDCSEEEESDNESWCPRKKLKFEKREGGNDWTLGDEDDEDGEDDGVDEDDDDFEHVEGSDEDEMVGVCDGKDETLSMTDCMCAGYSKQHSALDAGDQITKTTSPERFFAEGDTLLPEEVKIPDCEIPELERCNADIFEIIETCDL
jgi:hypothetical protein